jgi:hypothetical protein
LLARKHWLLADAFAGTGYIKPHQHHAPSGAIKQKSKIASLEALTGEWATNQSERRICPVNSGSRIRAEVSSAWVLRIDVQNATERLGRPTVNLAARQ